MQTSAKAPLSVRPGPLGIEATEQTFTHPSLHAICLIASLHQVHANAQQLGHQQGWPQSHVPSIDDMVLAAQSVGLRAKRSHVNPARLALQPLPAIALLRDGRAVVLAQCDGQRVLFQAPEAGGNGRPTIEPLDAFLAHWTGDLILITSRASVAGELARFDFSWFLPSLVKYRILLGEVLMVSIFLQLLALVSPLFFQVVMDKVLVHNGVTTLNVLIVGLLLVVTFESILSVLRSYVFSHTTNRIDVELGSRLFRHLLQLPLAYFQARRVGDSVARVRELENIRSFLTGSGMTLVLDAAFSVLFVAVMFVYSAPLTLVVLVSLPLYVAITLVLMPVLRARLTDKFARGADNQALLVETVSGMQTIKAAALEPMVAKRWDNQLAAYIAASFKVQTLASFGQEGIDLVGKLANAATLWYGAHLVMDQQLTVGQFVAFNMFAQRVATPVMRLAQLWTDFQQTGISMARLGDVLNTRTELPAKTTASLPPLKGHVQFVDVSFRYRPDAPAVLSDLSLNIAAGEVVGIVGRSGSGKSTLTHLVQRLYVPERGRVLVDGVDISLVDTAQLRRQIGVVLQENRLFNRSVRDNIAIGDPAAPIDAVMRAAELAGAHGFISALPEGYDTLVGEQGEGLSGGQRQRIAIARALFTHPRILIFDEATSALDYESEAILQTNMVDICAGRTVIIIAHRLSSVRHAHRIVAMDQGRIVEQGTHAELLEHRDGLYAHLWSMQSGTAK